LKGGSWLADSMTWTTYREDTDEICCPTCGVWVNYSLVEPDPETKMGTCPACRPELHE